MTEVRQRANDGRNEYKTDQATSSSRSDCSVPLNTIVRVALWYATVVAWSAFLVSYTARKGEKTTERTRRQNTGRVPSYPIIAVLRGS